MQYHHISGSIPRYQTGMPANVESSLKDGFDRFECEGLDATDFIPSGGMQRIEWQRGSICYWFESQLITHRGVQ